MSWESMAAYLSAALPIFLVWAFGGSAMGKLERARSLMDGAEILAQPLERPSAADELFPQAIVAAVAPAPPTVTLTPTQGTLLAIEAEFELREPLHWRAGLMIFNHGREVAEGRFHAVAEIALADGRIVRVRSQEQTFKARRMSAKSVELSLPGPQPDARLVRLEVIVIQEEGTVTFGGETSGAS